MTETSNETQSLARRLSSDRPLLLDGAMNTELARRGLVFDTHEWLRVNLDAPDKIASVHADYARAGAEIHIANSFATARHVLAPAGLAADFETLNRAAVSLCRDAIDEAASHPQWIAGSMSTFAPGHDRNNLPDAAELEANCRAQALILAGAGCDLLALEMLFDVDTSVAMMRGAAHAGLPVSLGLVCARDANDEVLLEGSRDGRRGKPNTALAEALPRILDAKPSDLHLIVAVMHSELEDTGPALELIRGIWGGNTAVYPNRGHYVAPGGWDASTGCSAAAFVAACEGWLQLGAKIVGGCCGVGPEHIRALARRLHGDG